MIKKFGKINENFSIKVIQIEGTAGTTRRPI